MELTLEQKVKILEKAAEILDTNIHIRFSCFAITQAACEILDNNVLEYFDDYLELKQQYCAHFGLKRIYDSFFENSHLDLDEQRKIRIERLRIYADYLRRNNVKEKTN